ncbi:Uu.00g123360.m01.CDS01 [Anthostomella pinea]|uniref:Uu.00g123360.m01.CDS01 n=1 Tax=Anthostomella pinea TaxID=933095 RepID=A0AAI8VC40_9PEZI|nr:Uu.00g123360.m01.CDS01 [Anthostomella pinea]
MSAYPKPQPPQMHAFDSSRSQYQYSAEQDNAAESPYKDITHKESKKPEQRPSPPRPEPDQLINAATISYGYPPAAHQAVTSSYEVGYSRDNSMIGPYHRSLYAADYPRPPLLEAPTWSPYGSSMTPHSPSAIHHAIITRPSITTLPMPTSSVPQLIWTSTIQTSGSSSPAQMNPYAMHSAKANLKIDGDLEAMASNWTQEEWDNRRRIVMFNRKQQSSTLQQASSPSPCIYWAEKNECYVTSVDTISLLEQLVASPARFTVEEKNRIQRNLEEFRPLTVSKAKADSEEVFKIIMAFLNPKPRNIAKDVKVFPWKILARELKKIVSRYLPSGPGPTMLTPLSRTSPGLYAMPHTPTVSDGGGYSHNDSHTTASPRSLSGAPPSWAAYAGCILSPSPKTHSPQAGIRTPGIPSYGQADARQHSKHHYGLAPHSQRWDSAVANGYGDASASPAYTSHHHQHQSHVCGLQLHESELKVPDNSLMKVRVASSTKQSVTLCFRFFDNRILQIHL